jgi:hypothetical protein
MTLKMATILEIMAIILYLFVDPKNEFILTLLLYFLYISSILWFLAFSFTIADICEKLQKSSDKN